MMCRGLLAFECCGQAICVWVGTVAISFFSPVKLGGPGAGAVLATLLNGHKAGGHKDKMIAATGAMRIMHLTLASLGSQIYSSYFNAA